MPKIASVERATLHGIRPRSAGSNARLGPHGAEVAPPIALITLDDGSQGFGWCRADEEAARAIIGEDLSSLFLERPRVVKPKWRAFDFPIWDLAAKRETVPVYSLVNHRGIDGPLSVPCYDTSLYMDDLSLSSDEEACALLAGETAEGMARGHAAFKIKIGRGAMHMDLEAGTARDIKIVHAVRKVAGEAARIMVDANNGLNLRLACSMLQETEETSLYWMEEPFHEDPAVYRKLREWMLSRGIDTLIADGEGDASARIEQWAADSLIDVIQYDLRALTFSGWLECGARLDAAAVRSAPHNYGEPTTNYYCAHLFPAIEHFEAVEWDEAAVEGITAPGYRIQNGEITVPPAPGFGLELDLQHFRRLVRENGFAAGRTA